jgi:hypothetical protein
VGLRLRKLRVRAEALARAGSLGAKKTVDMVPVAFLQERPQEFHAC